MSRLTALQERIIRLLAGITPAPALTGGGALCGFYTFHRETRDIDLFWHGRQVLGDVPADAMYRLRADGLAVAVLKEAPYIWQARVTDGSDVTIVDLVADPVPIVADPRALTLGGIDVLVDAEHEILVNKLCALLSRSELRDLEDVRALLDAGGDLDRALGDAPKKDGGFSPLTLAWLVEQLEVEKLGRGLGWVEGSLTRLAHFQKALVRRLVESSRPQGRPGSERP